MYFPEEKNLCTYTTYMKTKITYLIQSIYGKGDSCGGILSAQDFIFTVQPHSIIAHQLLKKEINISRYCIF